MDVIDLDAVNCLVRGRHGWFLANRFDHYLGAALIRYGECSEIEHRFLRSLVRPGDFVIEVGANIGVHAIGLAKVVEEQGGTVIAIEPQPEIFHVLCANVALNGLRNVSTFNVGCGARHDRMIVPAYDYRSPAPHNSGAVGLMREGPGHPVTVVPLDDLASDVPRLRLLKIDVEGMETEVIAGAHRIIERHRPLLYVENDRVEQSDALMHAIAEMDYRLYWHTPPLYNPDNFFGVAENAYPKVASFNLFCEPTEAAAIAHPELRSAEGPHPLRKITRG